MFFLSLVISLESVHNDIICSVDRSLNTLLLPPLPLLMMMTSFFSRLHSVARFSTHIMMANRANSENPLKNTRILNPIYCVRAPNLSEYFQANKLIRLLWSCCIVMARTDTWLIENQTMCAYVNICINEMTLHDTTPCAIHTHTIHSTLRAFTLVGNSMAQKTTTTTANPTKGIRKNILRKKQRAKYTHAFPINGKNGSRDSASSSITSYNNRKIAVKRVKVNVNSVFYYIPRDGFAFSSQNSI